jgi:hypothetical protein
LCIAYLPCLFFISVISFEPISAIYYNCIIVVGQAEGRNRKLSADAVRLVLSARLALGATGTRSNIQGMIEIQLG